MKHVIKNLLKILFVIFTILIITSISLVVYVAWNMKPWNNTGVYKLDSIDGNQLKVIEEAFDLALSSDKLQICILFLHDPIGGTAFMRVQMPDQDKSALLESGLFSGARREHVGEILHAPRFYPPEQYPVKWWDPNDQAARMNKSIGLRLNQGFCLMLEDEQGGTVIYIVRGSSLDAFGSDFLNFMRPYPAQFRSFMPAPDHGSAGCWAFVREDSHEAGADR